MDATVNGSGGGIDLERERLAKAVANLRSMLEVMMANLMGSQEDPKSIYKVGLGSVQFLKAFGDLTIGWLLISQAEVAAAALENGPEARDKDYYEGKITGAKFFARNMLPNLEATRIAVEQIDNDIMELDEAAF